MIPKPNLTETVYAHHEGEEFTYQDVLDACKGNETYALNLLNRMHMLYGEGYYPSTYVEGDEIEGEIIELENTYVLTGGSENAVRPRNVLFGQIAEEFFTLTTDEGLSHGGYKKGPEYASIGGYWQTERGWYAFDYTDGYESYDEPFASEEEARKYAYGIMATTSEGLTI